jgi:hypothetical protein
MPSAGTTAGTIRLARYGLPLRPGPLFRGGRGSILDGVSSVGAVFFRPPLRAWRHDREIGLAQGLAVVSGVASSAIWMPVEGFGMVQETIKNLTDGTK